MIHITHYASYKEMSIVGKNIFVDEIKKVIKKKKAIVAIPGGRSVKGLLSSLQQNDLDWSKVELFFIDERIVPLTDKNSNFKQANDLFMKNIPALHIHAYEPPKTAEQYTQELQKVSTPTTFDVILVAAGEDGHIASLHPLHHSIKKKGKKYFFMTDSPKQPSKRLSASPDMIKESNTVILLFASPEKKDAFERFMNEKVNEQECPAKIVKKAKEVYVLTSLT
jgi:6-phosphogluconolactonase